MKYEKQPLGIEPKWIWEEKRMKELGNAIVRYLEVGKKIPIEWVVEYNQLAVKVTERKRGKVDV